MSTIDYVLHGLGMQCSGTISCLFFWGINWYSGRCPTRDWSYERCSSANPDYSDNDRRIRSGRSRDELDYILLAGVYYGAMYGGSTTSILLNTPGESSSVVTTLDGLPDGETRQSRCCACDFGDRFLRGRHYFLNRSYLPGRPLSAVAIKFGPAEYFSLMVLGLLAISGLAGKSMVKALMMTAFGLLLATIGIDNVSGV